MLIDKSYFVGEISIPNTEKAAVEERLNHFIQKHEYAFMKMALPYDLFDDYLSNSLDEDVLYGTEYTAHGQMYKWDGLIQRAPDEDSAPRSIIANFIYFHWMSDKTTQSTGQGEAKPKGENSSPVNNVAKMSKAWNEMATQLREMWHFLQYSGYLRTTTVSISSSSYRGFNLEMPEVFSYVNQVL